MLDEADSGSHIDARRIRARLSASACLPIVIACFAVASTCLTDRAAFVFAATWARFSSAENVARGAAVNALPVLRKMQIGRAHV